MSAPFPPLAATADRVGTDLDVNVGAWGLLTALVIVMLVVDLLIFGRGRREVTLRESVIWSVVWIALAFGFWLLMWAWQGADAGSEYLTGYLLERSLSLDNIFVFAIIFGYFAVPAAVQPRVLAWGIALALSLRLVFIVAGAALLANFHATFYLFGALLLYTAYKLARHDETDVDPEHNPALRFVRKHVPMSADYRGHRLFTTEHGRRVATPLVAVFVVVATTDLIFAIDSIPAIFAITQEPFVVFAANAFAMLGLRALYFVLVGMMDRFVYLSQGLAVILAVIGAKMLLIDVWHPPIWLSLAIIAAVLAATAALSLRAAPPEAPRGA
ncbi:MAG TPA: TerC family protein [Solirubrobacteraceae bacterium]|nr:TerC family protein [Solirubrobacteraceae bacterium]